MAEIHNAKRVLIIGGGFGGISAALALAKYADQRRSRFANTSPDAASADLRGKIKITLVSDKPHFEFTPALYRVVTGTAEVRVSLREIFKGREVEIMEDSITAVDLTQKSARGRSGAKYDFDFLILALGSETAYFNIPGLKEFSFGFKSVEEALRLRQHIDEMFRACKISDTDKEEDVCRLNFLIVGGGASGTELAGELAICTKNLARDYGLDPSLITIDLFEAAGRLIPVLPPKASEKVRSRLHKLGVNIFLHQVLVEEEIEKVHLRDMELRAKTVIWTAGVRPHHLFSQINGLKLDEKGRVVVDEYLQAEGQEDVFVIGDGAATPYTGMAQTAIYDGKFVADAIARKIRGRELKPYRPKRPAYALPVGSGWAAVIIGRFTFYGRIGWWIRLLADLQFFLSILPPVKALRAFRGSTSL